MSDSRPVQALARAAPHDDAPAGTSHAPPAMVACDLREAHAHAAGTSRNFLAAGNPRPVLQAALDGMRRGSPGVLALVLEADGSTYAQAGAMALFADDTQVGWLSGGCLEPELARCAAQAAAHARLAWMEIDTRDDGALLSGGALGCRGRLRIALLPLAALRGAEALFSRWLGGGAALARTVEAEGRVSFRIDDAQAVWSLPCDAPTWPDAARAWSQPLPRPPEALLLGAGPETPLLSRLLRELGWRVSLAESRPRWRDANDDADVAVEGESALRNALARTDVALVMHHAFERDLEALLALAPTRIPFVGLLGPPRRRDDLLKLLGAEARAALAPRLRAPVGLDLGGRGPEAIALSIAAQLQGWRASTQA